jgi:MoaA/NifB/PqqE/SkfB family radical SAM enzyme
MRLPGKWSISLKMTFNLLNRAARLYRTNGSLRAWQQAAAHIYLKLAGQAPPTSATLASTYRCQCKCDNCYAAVDGRNGVDEMSTEELKAVIDQLKGLGSLQLIITGGEPLLREDIFELIAHAHNIGLLTRISTNGFLLTRTCVAELKRAGLNQCGVAIDDASPDTHDRLRGQPGIFEKAIQGLRYLHEYDLDSKIITYATNRNIPEGLERIIELGRELKVRSIYINIPYASGRWYNAQLEVLSAEKMTLVSKLHDSAFVQLEFPTLQTKCCAYNKAFVYVNAMGEVTPCPVVPFVIGNIKDEPLADIWRRHVSSLRLEFRGRCPVNEAKAREALRAHAASVLARSTGSRGGCGTGLRS